MALKVIEGFESQLPSGASAGLFRITGGAPTYAPGRQGGTSKSMSVGVFEFTGLNMTTANLPWVVSFALKINSWTTGGVSFCALYNSDGGSFANIQIDATNKRLQLGTPGGNLLMPQELTTNEWHRVDLVVRTVGGTGVGNTELWVDGTLVIDAVSNNVPTTGPGNTVLHRTACLVGVVFDGNLDDLYILDGSGSGANDRLGEVHVETKLPMADADVSWVPSSGVSQFATIDELPASTADYNTDNTLDTTAQLFGVQDTADTFGTVYGVQVRALVSKTDNGPAKLALLGDDGTTSASVTPSSELSVAPAYVASEIMEEDPNDSTPWDHILFSSYRFGYQSDYS